MRGTRLEEAVIDDLLADWPEGIHGLAHAARARVLELAPALDETIAFHALCYHRRGAPYGVIGGNVCLVAEKKGRLALSFLHGAFLPDPERLLTGTAKSKRDLWIGDERDLKRAAVTHLIEAAAAYDASSQLPR